MIKRADASKISREKVTKEQIAENFKRLAIDTDKTVQLKPSLLKIQKTLDGNTFGIIHENKTYYLKYTTKNGSSNPIDFKHLDGLNSTFGIEKHNSFQKAVNKMSFICEAQDNAHKLRLLNEKDEKEEENVTEASEKEKELFTQLEKPAEEPAPAEPAAEKPATPETPVAEPAADMSAAPEGGEELPAEEPAPAEPAAEEPAAVDTTMPSDTGNVASDILDNMNKPEAGDKKDLKDEIKSKIGETQEFIKDIKEKKEFDSSFIRETINSFLGYWGDALSELDDKDLKAIKAKLEGSQVGDETSKSEEKPEEPSVEEPSDEEMSDTEEEKLDENFLFGLKKEAKKILKEQIQEEIIRRKRSILIESIKRKLA